MIVIVVVIVTGGKQSQLLALALGLGWSLTKIKIPALWVLLKFLGQVPIGKNFNFLDKKNRYLAPCAS